MSYSAIALTPAELNAVGNFLVTLSSVGNPDKDQDPSKPLPWVRNNTYTTTSMLEASMACQSYIATNSLGAGNWSGGDIYQNGKIVARVSYNGRVWHVSNPPEVQAPRPKSVTGRQENQCPNLQNIPIGSVEAARVKRAFKPDLPSDF